MDYIPKEVDNKELENQLEEILAGKDIPISLIVNDDPAAAIHAFNSHRRMGAHRPISVKAQIKIQILEGEILDVDKIIDFTYRAYIQVGNNTHQRRSNITFPENGSTNPSTYTIPAGSNHADILVGISLPGGEAPGTFYASILMEVTADKTSDLYKGRDEILVRFDKP